MSTIAFTELPAAVGQNVGVSRWFDLPQGRIDSFAATTEDRQWIHTDAERGADGPFGATIAHGFLTLSLFTVMLTDLLDVPGTALCLNYGFDQVGFTAPVRVGSRVRGGGEISAVSEVAGGLQVTVKITVHVEAETKPACVADWLIRYYAETA
jgi:acyl dehydratase